MALFRENDEMPELGNVLDPNNLDKYPYLLNWPCDNTSLYTFVMTDPDSPSKYKPKMREWQHWLVGNIHVAVEEGDFLPDVFESDMMSKYIPPYPKKGTGFHRIVFLVYKQPMGRIEFKEKLLSYKMSQLSISSSDDEPLIITATPLTSPSTTGAALLRAAAKLQTSTHTPPPQARQPTQPAQARLQTYKSPTRQPTRPAKITSRGPSRQHPQMSRPHPSTKPATTVFRRLGPLPTASARSSGPSAASTTTRLTRNPSGPPPAAFSPRTAARVPRAFTSKRASRASPPSTLTDSRSRQPPAAARRHPGRKPPRTLSPIPPTPPRPRPTSAVRPSPIIVSDDPTPPPKASTVILPPRTAVLPARRFGDISHMVEVRSTRDVATQTTVTQPARTSVATTTTSTQTPADFFWSLLRAWVRRQLEHLIARSRSRAREPILPQRVPL